MTTRRVRAVPSESSARLDPSTARASNRPTATLGQGVQRVLRGTTGLLAAVAAVAGVMSPSLYHGLLPASLLPGAYGQDLVTVLTGTVLLALTVAPRRGPRRELIELGLVGYLAYADGIFAIERMYNPLYLGYLAVFALAVWTIVLAVRTVPVEAGTPTSWARIVCAVGALLQPLVFVPLWIVALVPLMAERRQIDSLYSVYILDLGFVMPAFLVTAVLLLRRRPSGSLLAPPMFVLGTVLIGSLAVSALVGPAFGIPTTGASLLPSAVLAVLFALLTTVSLTAARFTPAGGGFAPSTEPTH